MQANDTNEILRVARKHVRLEPVEARAYNASQPSSLAKLSTINLQFAALEDTFHHEMRKIDAALIQVCPSWKHHAHPRY